MNTSAYQSNKKDCNNSSVTKNVFIDLAYVLGTLITLKEILLQFPTTWTFAGPISLLCALAVAKWRLKVANQSWGALGFKK